MINAISCSDPAKSRTDSTEESHGPPTESPGASKYTLRREFSLLSNTILDDADISRNFASLPAMSNQGSSCYRFPAHKT